MRRRKRSFRNSWIAIRGVRAAQPHGVRVEVWFQDEARIGQKNSLTRVWGQTGSRPVAPKDLGFASAYLFGAVCPSAGKAAALIMPIYWLANSVFRSLADIMDACEMA